MLERNEDLKYEVLNDISVLLLAFRIGIPSIIPSISSCIGPGIFNDFPDVVRSYAAG